jgi:hypothetical protein
MKKPADQNQVDGSCAVFKLFSVAAVAMFVSSAAPAFAAGSYVGKWATNASQCRLPQSNPKAPLLLGETTYDQHEAHCTFRASKGPFRTALIARCSVEGDAQNKRFIVTVIGDRLTLSEGRTNARTFIRCPR